MCGTCVKDVDKVAEIKKKETASRYDAVGLTKSPESKCFSCNDNTAFADIVHKDTTVSAGSRFPLCSVCFDDMKFVLPSKSSAKEQPPKEPTTTSAKQAPPKERTKTSASNSGHQHAHNQGGTCRFEPRGLSGGKRVLEREESCKCDVCSILPGSWPVRL